MRGRSVWGPPNGAFVLGEDATSATTTAAAASPVSANGSASGRLPFRPVAGVLRRSGVRATLRRQDDPLGREARPGCVRVHEGLEEEQQREHDRRDARRAHQHRHRAGDPGDREQRFRTRRTHRAQQRASVLALRGAKELRVLLNQAADARERDHPRQGEPHPQRAERIAGAGTTRPAHAPRSRAPPRSRRTPAAPRAPPRSAVEPEAVRAVRLRARWRAAAR